MTQPTGVLSLALPASGTGACAASDALPLPLKRLAAAVALPAAAMDAVKVFGGMERTTVILTGLLVPAIGRMLAQPAQVEAARAASPARVRFVATPAPALVRKRRSSCGGAPRAVLARSQHLEASARIASGRATFSLPRLVVLPNSHTPVLSTLPTARRLRQAAQPALSAPEAGVAPAAADTWFPLAMGLQASML